MAPKTWSRAALALCTVIGAGAGTAVVASAGSTPARARPAATAAPAIQQITVTPSTNLRSGQTVTVAGTNWPANTPLKVAEFWDDRTDLFAQGPTVDVTSNGAGAFTTHVVVHTTVAGHHCPTCSILAINPATSLTAQSFITFADFQPDARIRRRNDGTLIGDDILNTNAAGQAQSHAIGADGLWTFSLSVENDGVATDDVKITGTAGSAQLAIRYFVGFFEVTAAVTGSGFTLSGLAPGATQTVAVRFQAAAGAPAGASRTSLVTVASGHDPTARDAVKVTAAVPAPPTQ